MRLAVAAFGLVALMSVPPALAQVSAGRDRCVGQVDISRAIQIALGAGIARADEVDCSDGLWEVEGRDAQGRRMEVYVDPRDGQVRRVERD